jgi:murein DD-endopeptidase MepM/ murein hydrolase activator NlpD
VRPSPRQPGRTRRLRAWLTIGGLFVLIALVFGALLAQNPVRQIWWYLTDETTPVVTISVPQETVRGVVTATIDVRDEGPAAVATVLLDSRPLMPTAVVVIDTAALTDGLHELMVEAQDLSRQRNEARKLAYLRTENSPPTATILLDPPLVPQGATLVVHITLSKPASLTAQFDGGPWLLATVSDTLRWGIVGFGADARLLTHTLTFSATDRLGNTGRYTTTFGMTRTLFVTENINLPPDRQGLANSAEETRRLDAAFATLSMVPLWKNTMEIPASGETTAPFGEARSYNGGPVSSWHGGVDLGAAAGAPVGAAAAGRVILAEKFTVQGNTVVIDHGLGLVSAYYHMESLKVKPGDVVKQGQAVGLVGNTGLSTGPHLHWEMRVTGVAVDPWPWTTRVIP